MYDLIILGGGPAGAAGAVYAARKKLNSLLITSEFGGQSTVSPDIQNWIGTVALSGEQLAKDLEAHVRAYAADALTIQSGEKATGIEKSGEGFTVTTDKGSYETKTVLIATGADRRRLTIPGADKFEGKGVVYCASCDGPLFSGMDVAVIGGGNAGFETAAQLLAYTKSVTLIDKNGFKADQITIDKVLQNENITAHTGSEPIEIVGDKFVSGLKFKNVESGEETEIQVNGVFVEIGLIPNITYVEGFLDMDEHKRIIVDAKNQQTSVPGIWAAGDCTDELYHQNNIAAGDGVKALEDIYNYLHTR